MQEGPVTGEVIAVSTIAVVGDVIEIWGQCQSSQFNGDRWALNSSTRSVRRFGREVLTRIVE